MKPDIHVVIIKDATSLATYLKGLKLEELCFDTESFDLSWESPLFGISLYDNVKPPAFVVTENNLFGGVPLSAAKKLLNPVFENCTGIAHNAKYDLSVFKQYGFSDPKLIFDTMLAVHIYDPDMRKKLETRVAEDFEWSKPTFLEYIKEKFDIKVTDWTKVPWDKPGMVDLLGQYSGEDVYGTRLLYNLYSKRIREMGSWNIMEKIEVPICYVLRDMKHKGVLIDVPLLKKMDVEMDKELIRVENEIYRLADCRFNLNSPKQKAEVLYDKMGYNCPGATKKGGRATDKGALEVLASEGAEIAEVMIEYSGLNKLSTGYVKAIPLMVNRDGRLRGNFNSEGARTGRMSSSEPNLQNQPARGKSVEKFPVRDAFMAAEGNKLIVLDFSQIELRVMAHCSRDPHLMKAFWDGEDIHGFVARTLGISRAHSKIVNFGIMYGMGPDKLAVFLGISKAEAKAIIEGYHRSYPGYDIWKQQTENFAFRNGYVKNIFGRVRRLPDAMSKTNWGLFAAAMRQAINTQIQGAAADLMKLVMIKIFEEIGFKKLVADMILVVHDEVALEAAEHVPGRLYHLEEVYDTVKHTMENYVRLNVPVVADGKVCDRWGQMKDDSYISYLDRPKITTADLLSWGLLNENRIN